MFVTGKVSKTERRSKLFCSQTDGVLVAITTAVTLSATQSGSSVSDIVSHSATKVSILSELCPKP